MLLIFCPYCEEERPELEFRHAGEAHVARSPELINETDEAFERFLYLRQNPKGVVFERWRHIHGCARFFNAARDTVSDKFLHFYKAGEPKPDLRLADNDPGPAAYANRPPAQLNVAEPAPSASSGDAS
ncbi:MAG TPA: sarcosine oxidase subunit delta [Mesorhizobium sp.]|jgi:sarcosine oxidase subunit delta|nr:sarcosine oxidase subunit delta [Mesorhizobium sp.]